MCVHLERIRKLSQCVKHMTVSARRCSHLFGRYAREPVQTESKVNIIRCLSDWDIWMPTTQDSLSGLYQIHAYLHRFPKKVHVQKVLQLHSKPSFTFAALGRVILAHVQADPSEK